MLLFDTNILLYFTKHAASQQKNRIINPDN
jgi:predicted nucleic acid-binding protein